MSMIAIIGQVEFQSEDASAAAELMRAMMSASMKEQGCHHYSYASDLEAPNRFQLSELWESEEALAAHFQTAHMATYRAGIRKLHALARKVQRFDVMNTQDL